MKDNRYLSEERLGEIAADRELWMMGFKTIVIQVVGIIMIICQLLILGAILTRPKIQKQEVHVPIRSGEVTTGVPCFAVYNDNGVLKAVTAEADMHGVLHEFNVLGGRIDPTPLPEPWRWFELNAAFSMEEP